MTIIISFYFGKTLFAGDNHKKSYHMLDVVIRDEISLLELKLAKIGNRNNLRMMSDASGPVDGEQPP